MTSIPIGARESAAAGSSTRARRACRAAAPGIATALKAFGICIAYVVLIVALMLGGVPAVVACAVGALMVMAAAWRFGMLRSL